MNVEYLIMLGAVVCGLVFILSSALFKRHARPVPGAAAKTSGAADEFSTYRKLTATEPENAEHWLKWGNALSISAPGAKNPDLIIHRYNEACACFQRAVDLSPAKGQAWKNWGQTLFELYRMQNCEDQQLLHQANQKYQNAALLSPDNALIWQQWGDELRQSAHIATGDLKNSLMEESIARIARGSELNLGFAPMQDAGQTKAAPDAK